MVEAVSTPWIATLPASHHAVISAASVMIDSSDRSAWWTHAGDAALLLAVAFAIPFAILAVGIPVALMLRLLLWIGGLL